MAINWRLRSNVFQLLAAVYAELGEEAFKGRYASIAQYFGPEASYDAIKSFFSKEVSKTANQLKAQVPSHRGSARGVPARSSAGPSRRPPHLSFDDEEISILTQREIEAVEARFGLSLRAPTKRPQVFKTSPPPSPELEVIHTALLNSVSRDDPPYTQVAGPQGEPARSNHVAAVLSHSTVQSDAYQTAPEGISSSRKRPFSEVRDSIEPETIDSARQSATPHFESFGYVTNQGQYRCALCLSQLPSLEDLIRHEQVSKEHSWNLQLTAKLAKGREKLAQVKIIPEVGRHHSTPVPLQLLSIPGYHEPTRSQAKSDSANLTARQEISVQATPSDTVEVRRGSFSPEQDSRTITTPAPQPEPNETFDKGKSRAISVTSSAPSMQPPRKLDASQLQTPSQAPSSPDTRPTTARTEIGTLNTPHSAKNAFMPPTPQMQTQVPQPRGTGSAPAFSKTDIADVLRSTEIMIQLMGSVRREAKAVAAAYSEETSFDSGVQLREHAVEEDIGREGGHGATGSAPGSDAADASWQLSGGSSGDSTELTRSQASLQAPGIEVHHGLKRQSGETGGRGKKSRRKDTGSEVSFIVLE